MTKLTQTFNQEERLGLATIKHSISHQVISLAVEVFWTLISPINKHLGVQAIRIVSSYFPKDTDINFTFHRALTMSPSKPVQFNKL